MAFLDELFRQMIEAKKDDDDDFVPGWDEEECREGADDSNVRPQDYMDDKFEKCETTMSGDIATVPMGFKGLKKDERTPVEHVERVVGKLLGEQTGEASRGEYEKLARAIAAWLLQGISREAVVLQSKREIPSGRLIHWNNVERLARNYINNVSFKGSSEKAAASDALYDVIDDLEKYKSAANAESVREAWGHMECPNCGAKVTGDTCPRCGEPIDEGVQDDETIPLPVITRPETALCHNCYEKQRQPGKRFCADCEKLMPKESVEESVDESVFGQLVHYKESIPHLIGVIESIVSSNTPADSDELYDELAEVVTHLAKADHMLAVLVTSKNLRTPRADPEDEKEPEPEPEPKEPEEEMPHAGAPMDRPDETEDERYHAPRH